MRVWDLQDGACQEPIDLPAEKCTALMHPDTYLNKILLAFENGVMELWNLRTRSRVFRFTGFATKVLSAITTVVQSPAVDVVAVGFQNGQTVLHNLKFDKSIGSVQQVWRVFLNTFLHLFRHAHYFDF
jgi:U3 small nucleolar RNA-associated protein 21